MMQQFSPYFSHRSARTIPFAEKRCFLNYLIVTFSDDQVKATEWESELVIPGAQRITDNKNITAKPTWEGAVSRLIRKSEDSPYSSMPGEKANPQAAFRLGIFFVLEFTQK